MRLLRVDMPTTVAGRLGAFAVVLALATSGGWFAGQSVGPIRLPPPETLSHEHLEGQ